MTERLRSLALIALSIGLLSFSEFPYAAAADTKESYTWSAELIHFDEAASMVTVRARVTNLNGISSLEEVSEGDRVYLTWSGFASRAAGVREISLLPATEFDRFSMPVEFVATSMTGRYVEFRLPIPSDHAPKIRRVEPGRWVTATSPHQPNGDAQVVTSIRAFTDVS